jgi:hypothetical protein
MPLELLPPFRRRLFQRLRRTARVREALKRKMKNHSKDFLSLPLHIVLADFAAVQRATQGIMNEPRIDKASAGDDLSGLSGPFFQLQDQLRERAGALNKAAQGKDVSEMTAALGPMMETCATCCWLPPHLPRAGSREEVAATSPANRSPAGSSSRPA